MRVLISGQTGRYLRLKVSDIYHESEMKVEATNAKLRYYYSTAILCILANGHLGTYLHQRRIVGSYGYFRGCKPPAIAMYITAGQSMSTGSMGGFNYISKRLESYSNNR